MCGDTDYWSKWNWPSIMGTLWCLSACANRIISDARWWKSSLLSIKVNSFAKKKQDIRLPPGYFPPSNFVKNAFKEKLLFYVRSIISHWLIFLIFPKLRFFFWKKPWILLGLYCKGYCHFLRILQQICCFFASFKNFVFAFKKSQSLPWKPKPYSRTFLRNLTISFAFRGKFAIE